MNKKYIYSLIVPHYNTHCLLGRLLDSVPKRDDLQIIVVDDCSTKDLEILEEIKKSHPNVEWYSTETNGGSGKARNIGLQHINGKYLLFADSDDTFTSEINSILNDYKDKDFDLLYFNVCIRREEDNKHITGLNYISNSIINYQKSCNIDDIRYHQTQPWCKIISSRLTIQNRITFEESCVSNDVKFSTLVDYYSKRILASKIQGYNWHIRNNSISHDLNPTKILTRLRIDIERHDFLSKRHVKDSLNYLQMLNKVWDSGDPIISKKANEIIKSYHISHWDISLLKLKRRIKIILGRYD